MDNLESVGLIFGKLISWGEPLVVAIQFNWPQIVVWVMGDLTLKLLHSTLVLYILLSDLSPNISSNLYRQTII